MFVKLFSVSDCFDFNESIFWQFSNFKSSASWAVFGEEGSVNFVHSSEIAHVLQQNGGFNYVFHGQTLCFQDSLNVFRDCSVWHLMHGPAKAPVAGSIGS